MASRSDPRHRHPPVRPSDEADTEALDLAQSQGDAYRRALDHMAREEAHVGGMKPAGDYVVAFAQEAAEGMWHVEGGELRWRNPADEENAHFEVAVMDGGDQRFVPGLRVTLTVRRAINDEEVGTHEPPFIWHPWLHHYGRNWTVPGDGKYHLLVRIEPPTFHRHDPINGRRYAEVVEVEFRDVEVKTGRKTSTPE